jgi:adenylate cyclase
MSVDTGPRKVGAEYAIEYLQEHPEAGLCCEDRRCWITPNANQTNQQVLLLDEVEAERLKDDPRLRLVSGIAHADRSLWVLRRMT